MKKTNKKQIPKVRLPKYSPGGTQDAYNQKRSKGLSNGQYAQYAAIAANTGSNIYGIQNSDIGNTSKTKATTGAIGEGVTQGIGTINPLIGAGTGIRKTAVGMVGDKQGAARTASNWAAAPHESAINDIGAISSADNNTQKAGSVVAAIGDITGMTKMRQMISYGTKNDEKTTGGWGKYNDMVGISSRNNQKQDILNEQTQQQEAAQAAQDSQQAAYQQQQTDFINNAVQSGMANYNQNNPQGGANNTIQYAKYGGQMKFAMGGENSEFAPTSLTTNNIIPAVPAPESTYGTTTTNENMTPSQWKTYNTSQGLTESPIKSKTGYSDFYNSLDYVPQKNTDNDYSFLKTKDVGKVVNYTNDPNYKPIQSYSGKRIADPSNASQHISTGVLRDGRHLRTYRDGHTEIVGQPRTTEPLQPLQSLASHKYGGYMKYGMGGMNMQPNAELENREMYRKTNGQINEVNGNSHEEGGVPINIPGGTEMLPDNASNFLRINKKIVFQNPGLFTKKDIGKTFSESSRNLKTTKEEKNINNKDATPLSQTTNSLIMNAKNIIYSRKMDVLKQVKQDKVAAYAKRMGVELPSMDNEQMEPQGQSEQSEGEIPMNKYGGRFAMGGMQQYAMGGVQLPYYNIDRNGNPKYTNGGKMPKYSLAGTTPIIMQDNGAPSIVPTSPDGSMANTESSFKLDSNAIGDKDNNFQWNYVNGKYIQPDSHTSYNLKVPKKPKGPEKPPFNWKDTLSQVANFAAQNAGNIYNLSRYNKPEIETYERAKASYLDNTAAMRDAEQEARRDEYAVRGASGGNAGTYLANRVGLNTAKVMNKDRIRQQYANANAQIGNQNAQFNTDIAMREVIANAQNRARNRSGKGEAIGDIGQNFGVASKAGKQGEMDQKTLALIMKYYNTPEFQKMMKDNKFT
jgi:hypothetical protein